ncbi:MAG: energy transducer TonB [Proteobacteria bacterium]|nr:energy transducer TonB [Pseudomonadota bacterium]
MNMAIRLPVAFVLGLLFSAGLFWFLWIMVSGTGHFGDLKPAVKIDFTPLKQDTETATKREKVVQPKPEKMPEIPQITSQSTGFDGGGVSQVIPTFDTSGMGQISVGSDRDVIPLVRINPEYPSRARSRGIEGWVQVEFAITPAGTVADAKVVDADPKGLFERAALDAISRWKYNPKVVDGRAMERRGVQVVLTFKLEK